MPDDQAPPRKSVADQATVSEKLPGKALTDQDAAQRILKFLQEPAYLTVAEALVYLETHSGKLRVEGFTNLRDVLDHLTRAARSGTSEAEFDHHLTEAREHLRRAVMHPYQDEIEERLGQLERTGKSYLVRRELFPDIPTERDFRERLNEAKKILAQARLLKGDAAHTVAVVALLRDCMDKLEALSTDVRTRKAALFVRLAIGTIFALVLGILGIILAKVLFGIG